MARSSRFPTSYLALGEVRKRLRGRVSGQPEITRIVQSPLLNPKRQPQLQRTNEN